MSPRTLIVGILAAVCGVCATAGVMTWNRSGNANLPSQKIITAKIGIELGSKIETNMLKSVDWPSDKIPTGALASADQVVGKYCIYPIFQGQPLLAAQLDNTPTTLQPDAGFLAVAIDTDTESSSLGKNLVAGNRVDVIWVMTKNIETLGGPFSTRLLENVRVLAVGQNSKVAQGSDLRRELKSVTLEVRAKMDENLVLAQELGTLSLAMRNPNDKTSVEPTLVTNIADLLKNATLENATAKDSPTLDAVDKLKSTFDGLLSRVDQLNQKIDRQNEKPTAEAMAISDESRKRIPAGMVAVAVQTPIESTGVAGLLLPGHRVDVVVTWENQIFDRFNSTNSENEPRSIVLLENVEILAVDTQLIPRDDSAENKEMSRSVTLIVTKEMLPQVTQAVGIGTITLALRGIDDSQSLEPRLIVDLNQYLGSRLSDIKPVSMELRTMKESRTVVPIRFNRGGANHDQMFSVQPSAAEAK